MGKYFGTDGFRGEAGITLTADHAYKVGRFLGWYYNALRERNGDNEPARIVIGKDTRRSSYMFEYSLVAGLTASGADSYLLHVTTTPSVAYIARVDNFDCGIMISASHNPYYDNGIKLIDCYGEKMPEEILLLVEDYIDGKLHVFDDSKLLQLTNAENRSRISARLYTTDRLKTTSHNVLVNIDTVYKAICNRRKITFHYWDYAPSKDKTLNVNSEDYIVSPYTGYGMMIGIICHLTQKSISEW